MFRRVRPRREFRPGDVARHDELALEWRKQWQPGQELRIRFLDGDAQTKTLVEQIARTWLRHAGLHFVFGDRHTTELRITFSGNGYWSYVGTDALRIHPDRPTMRLGGLSAGRDPALLRRVVLHEFGHAIGCVHEQSSPAAAIPWNEPAVYAYYRKYSAWSDEEIRRNVLLRYSAATTRFTAHDPASIMQYAVPASLTVGGYQIPWNNELSPGDKSFIARMYPRAVG